MSNGTVTPMLFPYDPEQFRVQIRAIIREEMKQISGEKTEADVLKVEEIGRAHV